MQSESHTKFSGEAGNDGRPVTLVKGGHRWVFSCEPGDEPALLARLAELARRSDTPFDWFDAALVSHQLRKRLNAGLHRVDATPGGVADQGTSSLIPGAPDSHKHTGNPKG